MAIEKRNRGAVRGVSGVSSPPRLRNAETATLSYVRGIVSTIDVLFQGKWKVQILCLMLHGSIRIGQLGRMLPKASKKMLTHNLRQLEADGIVERIDLSDVVLHVEYQLKDEIREHVHDLLDSIANWGTSHLHSNGKGSIKELDTKRAAGERGPESSE